MREARPDLRARLEQLATLGDRFPVTCQPAPSGHWTAGSLLAGPTSPAWPAVITDYAITLGTDQPRIAASIALQHYGTRVAGVAIGSWALLGVVPSLDHSGLHVRFDRGRTAQLWLPDPRPARAAGALEPSIKTLGRELFSHLEPVVAAVRTHSPLNRRRAWGNLAASCAGVFSALDRLVPPWHAQALRAAATEFFAVPEWPVAGLVDWRVWGAPPADGLCHERRTCCLIRDIPGKQPCESCSIRPPAERRSAWERSLRAPRQPPPALALAVHTLPRYTENE